MALIIKKENSKYQLISSITNESYHDEEWIDENEAKKVLIENAFIDFVENAIKINEDFPNSYQINGEPPKEHKKGSKKVSDLYENENVQEAFENEFEKIYKNLKLDFIIP